ncbi:hypothetical protein FRC02_012274 [Tulasnella sp. 418]|nr:hypothetical protein FRC02_012274 [Tulasnella sp. 418]
MPPATPLNYAAAVKSGRHSPLAVGYPSPQQNKRSRTSTPRPGSRRGESSSGREETYKKDIYLVFVRNALQEKTKGNSEGFDKLVSKFSPSSIHSSATESPVELRSWVNGLSHIVTSLERVHAPLVDALVALPWTTMDAAFVKCYIGFIGTLVSAKPEYLKGVLSRTVQGFTHQSGLRALNVNQAESSTEPMTRRIVYDRLHTLLEHLLSIIPTLSSILQPLLIQNFPHKRQEKVAQVTYIKNLLRVSEYCRGLSDKILATVIDRAIQIDVEVQVELEDLEDEGLAETADILSFDPFDAELKDEGDVSDSGGDEDDDEEGDGISDLSSEAESISSEEPSDRKNELAYVIDMVSKLDAILKLVFEHFQSLGTFEADRPPSTPLNYSHPSHPAFSGLRRNQFLTLLTIFDRTILKTFKSRYTQFLVFWYSSLDMEFSDLFQGLLVSKALFEADQPAVMRAAAASYIASYVSRAQFVDRESARRVAGLLCDFLERELEGLAALSESGIDVIDARTFSVFYAVAQAVFLIFCFRWRDFLHEDEHYGGVDDMEGFSNNSNKKWMPQLDVIQRVITSPLNPLKICSQNVVRQFAKISQATGFVYCYSILESNRRTDLSIGASPGTPTTAGQSKVNSSPMRLQNPKPTITISLSSGVDADLNTFFPFDPYRLPSSMSYIEGLYREWSSVALEEEEDDEDEPEEDEVGGNDDPSMMVVGSTDDELGRSFGGMSISPARPMIESSMIA